MKPNPNCEHCDGTGLTDDNEDCDCTDGICDCPSCSLLREKGRR